MNVFNQNMTPVQEQDFSHADSYVRSDAGIFVRQTYAYFGGALFVSTLGALFGLTALLSLFKSIAFPIGLWVVNLVLIIALSSAKRTTPLVIFGFFAMAFLSGIGLTGVLAYTLAKNGAVVIAEAFFLTTAAFAGLSVYAFVTKRDFSAWGAALFAVLLVLVAACFLNLILAVCGVHVAWLGVGIACVGAILFSLYIIYDTQNLIRGEYRTPIQGAIDLYLDFYNLFVSLLRILNALRD